MLAKLRKIVTRYFHGDRRRRHVTRHQRSESLESRCLLSQISGRGQDALLIVNPDSESSIRIAAAWQELRHIPDNNVLFLSPPVNDGYTRLHNSAASFWNNYVQTVHSAIHERGLHDQIDFIAAIGQPHSFNDGSNHQSLSYGLTQLDQYAAGMSVSAAQSQAFGIARVNSPRALHHSDSYSGVAGGRTGTQRYYVSGLLGVTGQLGNSPEQVIASLRRSAAADGTKPAGTIYFEDNGNIRAATRRPQWSNAQRQLSARGIPTVHEYNVPGRTPRNRSDVRGAVIGTASATLPNGSQYLPGSWVDNLTSYGARYTTQSQTKATQFIATGAAASSGTVAEPYAIAARFPQAEIFTHIDSGLTLGEAFYQSVDDPDMQQFIGDILAQPYADTPTVNLTGPSDGAAISGTIGIDVTATVPAGGMATAVQRLELYVDGRLHATIQRSSGQFRIDTSSLSDGMHELRVVAIASNPAESEGIALRNFRVNNAGRFVAVHGTFSGQGDERVRIPVSVSAGNGTVQRVELRHLGRVVGTASGDVGSVELNLSHLAFGANRIVPVAVYSDGEIVAGKPIRVRRTPTEFPGRTLPSANDRTAGLEADYFLGQGGRSIDASDFSGTPDISTRHVKSQLLSRTNNEQIRLATTSVDGLAVRLRGSFDVSNADAGEYLWSSIGSNDSLRILIDGEPVLSYDNHRNGVGGADVSASTFLGAGRHDFEILSAATGADESMKINVVLRGPDGITRYLHENFVYTFADSASLAVPVITQPTGTISARRPDVAWTAVDGASEYHVQIQDAVGQLLAEATVTRTTMTPSISLPDGDYIVRVRARAQDAVSEWGSQTFRVEQATPNVNRAIIVEQTNGSTEVSEGGQADSITVRLSAAPLRNVTINAGAGVAGQIRLSRNVLTFTAATWRVPQNLSVSAIDDAMADGDQNVRLMLSVGQSSDPAWQSVSDRIVNVTVRDDDSGSSGGSGGNSSGNGSGNGNSSGGGTGNGGNGNTGGTDDGSGDHDGSGNTASVDELARRVAAERGLTPAKKDFYNWGGRLERWLRGTSGWYFILPDGTLYQWNGSPRNRLTGMLVARLDRRYHADLTLFAPSVSTVPAGTAGLVMLDRMHDFDRQPNDWLNWGGLQEKWFRSKATGSWFYLTPGGNFFRWTTGGRGRVRGELVASLHSAVYQDPSLLYEAEAIAADQLFGLSFSGSYHEDSGGLSEKWLRGNAGWYYLTPDGRLYRWNGARPNGLSGTLEAELDSSYYADPQRLFHALDRVAIRWAGIS